MRPSSCVLSWHSTLTSASSVRTRSSEVLVCKHSAPIAKPPDPGLHPLPKHTHTHPLTAVLFLPHLPVWHRTCAAGKDFSVGSYRSISVGLIYIYIYNPQAFNVVGFTWVWAFKACGSGLFGLSTVYIEPARKPEPTTQVARGQEPRYVEFFAGQANVYRMISAAGSPACALDIEYLQGKDVKGNAFDILTAEGFGLQP